MTDLTIPAFLPNLNPFEILLLLGLGVLLFGRRLPEVGRSLGKTFVEFKKGVRGLEEEVESSGTPARAELPAEAPRPPQRVTPPSAPRFEDEEPASQQRA